MYEVAIGVFLLLVATVPSYYFYHQSQVAKARLNDTNTANRQVIDEVVKKASKHILLPSGEQPTLATVSDVSKVHTRLTRESLQPQTHQKST